MSEFDVIVVGLGCVGISTAYYCAKKGLKVLGIDMASQPGAIGTSSFGETRIWRTTHGSKFKNDMMRSALSLWKEIEEECGEQLIVKTPVLTIGSDKNIDWTNLAAQFPDYKYLTPSEIQDKFPGLHNIPEHYQGILNDECGIVKARRSLACVRKLAEEKYGATLKFKTRVTKVTKNSVETEDGATYTAKSVVVSAGAYTAEDFDKNPSAKRLEVEYFVSKDLSGMPSAFVEFADNGNEYYGMLDGDNLDRYKMGDFSNRSFKSMIDYFKVRLPTKAEGIEYAHPCYFTMIETGEFQYKTDDDGVHFAYGFSGTGFKFLPLHGKIVYDGLINKIDETYIPAKFRAKM